MQYRIKVRRRYSDEWAWLGRGGKMFQQRWNANRYTKERAEQIVENWKKSGRKAEVVRI